MAVHDHKHTHGHGHGHAHEHCLKMARREDGTPWWTDFPEPKSVAAQVEPADVFRLLQDHDAQAGRPRDFLLVDARRSDCTGGTVCGAMNLPAHSFYPTRKSLYDLCKQAGIKKVIFYCGESRDPRTVRPSVVRWEVDMEGSRPAKHEGSSLGRGPRCAAWLQDHVRDVGGDVESLVMTGGIRGWVQAYSGGAMDGYDEKAWKAEGR